MAGGVGVPDASLPDRLRTHLRDTGLIPAGHPLVVAVSGGRDSVVLLHLLRFPLRDLFPSLEAAHVDHAMRPGSRADADWVRGLCRAWAVPLAATRLDPPARSEAEARTRRYAFLQERAAHALILTAHHRDDQAETVLFRVSRGTGVRGLRGIAPCREALVRPLLPYRRSELAAYARQHGLGYRDDPTNLDLRYARNRIRHRVLPELERIRPGTTDRLARLADQARATERVLDQALEHLEAQAVIERSETEISLARPVLASYDPALRTRLVRLLLRRLGSTPERSGTQAALEFISSGRSGGEIHVAGGIRIQRDFDRLRLCRVSPDPGASAEDVPLTIPGPEPGHSRARVGGQWLDVAWGPGVSDRDRTTLEAPVFPVTVRGWSPGDRIRLTYGSKKLKKLLAEHRLDRQARREVPVVVDGQGRILWVVGVARATPTGERGADLEIAISNAG